MENYYLTLGVDRQATAEQIKSAYRRCARDCHPDRCGTGDAFHAVQRAYGVLGHPEKRARYDALRRAWIAQLGAVECTQCAQPCRISRAVPQGYVARCWHCKAPLRVQPEELKAAERRALAKEVTFVLDTVGEELADLAVDGVRLGVGRLRRLLGLGRSARGTT